MLFRSHGAYLGELAGDSRRHDALCELNVIEQVRNVCLTSTLQEAWGRGQILSVHGWIYGVKDGLLRDMGVTVSAVDEIDAAMADATKRVRGQERRT